MHAPRVQEFLTSVDDWIHEATGVTPEVQGKLLSTVLTIVVIWAVRVLVLRLIQRRSADKLDSIYHWRKGSAYVAYVLIFLMVGRIWLASFASLATVIGLVSAGVAVALKDPLMNLAGWLFIVWRKPFELGDRVEIGDYRGDVVDQGIFTFSLMEIGKWVDADDRTGRLLVAPNGRVFTDVLANYSKGWFDHIWNELEVTITFESNWRAAKELMTEIAKHHGEEPSAAVKTKMKARANQYIVLENHLEPRVFTRVLDCGVGLTLRYLCAPYHRRRTEEEVWEDILDAFHEREDIDFAYPTVRYYDNVHEGKPEARAALPDQPSRGRLR